MGDERLFLAFLAAIAALVVFAVSALFTRSAGAKVRERLQDPPPTAIWAVPGTPPPLYAPAGMPKPPKPSLSDALLKVGATAGRRFEPKKESQRTELEDQLGRAGFYSSAAVGTWLGARVVVFFAFSILFYGIGLVVGAKSPLLIGVLGALLGFLGPVFWLKLRTARQQTALEHALPDALDLLVICVESGLTMDAAIQRVGTEIALPHPSLARELAMAHMETQMGLPRMDALRNIADRTGSDSVRSLVAMLVQAERFGTSIAQALRVYSESLRIKRRSSAEEKAGKTAVKMAIPLVLCVFPATMIVIGGPAVIRMMEMFSRMRQ